MSERKYFIYTAKAVNQMLEALDNVQAFQDDLVSPEDDPSVLPVSDREMQWVEANYAELRAQFGGEWIAVYGNTLVAHGTLAEVTKAVDEQGVNDPFMEWMPPEDEKPPVLGV